MTSLEALIPTGGGQNKIEFTASGAIAAGKPVILNSNGTVSQITGSTSAEDFTYGTGASVFVENTGGMDPSLSTDPFNEGKFIVGYEHKISGSANDGKPMVVVGTTSGSTITYGTPVVINSGSSGGNDIIVQFDPTYENRVIVSYYGGTNMGYTGVSALTLDGTAVTVHTPVQYYSSNGGKMAPGEMAFDYTKVGYFIMQYHDSANNGYYRGGSIASNGTITLGSQGSTYARWDKPGTQTCSNKSGKFLLVGGRENAAPYICAAVATIDSSRNVTVGTFHTGYSGHNGDGKAQADWDPNDDTKFVHGAVYSGSPYPSKVFVGTVAGTSITYGDPTTIFDENWGTGGAQIRFPPNPTTPREFLVAYGETGISPNIQLRIAKCSYSGTTITKHSTTSISNEYHRWTGSAEFDKSNGILYWAQGYDNAAAPANPNYGRIWMSKVETKPTNLTATNLIGIADEAIADGESGIINTWGSVNDTQSGMTIGSDYYAQHDGTITTTNSANSTLQQLVGKAISATKLNIKDYT